MVIKIYFPKESFLSLHLTQQCTFEKEVSLIRLTMLNIGMMEDNFLNFATISSEFDLLTVPRKLS